MVWEEFSAIALTIGYYMLLWLLIAIPATLILLAIARFFPTSPGEAAAKLWRFAPQASSATAKFFEALARARDKLSLGTVRILLDRKHAELKRELDKIRRVLDRQLAKLAKSSGAMGGSSLLDLIQSFQQERDAALEIQLLSDQLPDNSVAHSKAKSVFVFALFFMIIFVLVNFGLLYLFFDELFAGLTIPYIGVQLAIVAALIFPLVEAAGGVGSEFALEKQDGPGTRVIYISGIAFVMAALGALEFFIFYQLFAGGFGLTSDFPRGGFLNYAVACVGPALTIVEGIFGSILARNFLRLKDFSATKSLKGQVQRQIAFVEGLEGRFDAIDEASARAGQSLDELSAQLAGRGEARASIAAELEAQRTKFLEAMDSVNPRKWKSFTEPSAGDVSATTSFAWFIPLGLIAIFAIFAYVFQDSLLESGLVTSLGVAMAIATVVPIVALVSGGWIFERTSSAVDLDSGWKDVLSPRDTTFKIVGIVGLGLLAVSTLWICTMADGVAGLGEGLLLAGFLFGIAWVGSYIDLALRGLAFLATVLSNSLVWLLRHLARLIHQGTLLLAVVVSAVALLLLQIAAYPLTLLRSLTGQRKSSLALEPAR